MQDDKTTNFELLLLSPANLLEEDVLRLRAALKSIDSTLKAGESALAAEVSRVTTAEQGMAGSTAAKANLIVTPHIEWDDGESDIPAGRALQFDVSKTPVLAGDVLPAAVFAYAGESEEAMFGLFSNDGVTTQVGLFHADEDGSLVPDIVLYDGEAWSDEGLYMLRFGIVNGLDETIGNATLSGFDVAKDIGVPDVPAIDLVDVLANLAAKQNALIAGEGVTIDTRDPLRPRISVEAGYSGAKPPAKPTLISPVDGEEDIRDMPIFELGGYLSPTGSPASAAHFQVSDDPVFAAVVIDSGAQEGGLSWQEIGGRLAPDSAYFVRGRVRDTDYLGDSRNEG
jgi:hypothetical protein